uniref:Uncharacterized protein n=1 Tax=Anguilla anguilla TaxID=7936 RepID=A0A0E9SR52_ANGAN
MDYVSLTRISKFQSPTTSHRLLKLCYRPLHEQKHNNNQKLKYFALNRYPP